jgi:hypoxanthine phosphoribosyltransferase
MAQKRYLSWEEVESLVDLLIPRIDKEYDALLAITRGGLVPSGLISERLDIRHVLTASVQFYTGQGETLDWPLFLQFPGDSLLHDQRILVVDDIWDSGRTIISVKERVELAGGIPDLAVLHYKPANNLFPAEQPDYYCEITDAWIVYPWEPESRLHGGPLGSAK